MGNNPFVIGLPRERGPVVLDMALSQYAGGVMTGYALRGERLPVPGGFDAEGRLTDDATAMVDGGHGAAIGRCKGFALAVATAARGAVRPAARRPPRHRHDP